MKKTRKAIIDDTTWKLRNSLRSCAMFVKEDKGMTQEEKEAELEVLQDMLTYIQNYEGNTRKLQDYEEYVKRTEDDGR